MPQSHFGQQYRLPLQHGLLRVWWAYPSLVSLAHLYMVMGLQDEERETLKEPVQDVEATRPWSSLNLWMLTVLSSLPWVMMKAGAKLRRVILFTLSIYTARELDLFVFV